MALKAFEQVLGCNQGPPWTLHLLQPQHCHFHCSDCGKIFDIDLDAKPTVPEARLPRGFKPDQIEISMRGHCPDRGCLKYHKN